MMGSPQLYWVVNGSVVWYVVDGGVMWDRAGWYKAKSNHVGSCRVVDW